MIASTFSGVHDFFHSSTWYVIRNLAIFFVIVFWIASVYWVYKDARRRIEDPLIVWVVTAVGVVPFIGPLIYMLFRPPEYLDDVRERELEIKAMEKRLGGRDLHCPVCRAEVDEDFLICPVCTTKLRQACTNCQRPLEALWQVCPYCETPIDHDDDAPIALTERKQRPPRSRRSR
ncbi:MAG TPA: zinc ribbon domain-containing protein [Gaiellaceae bacterium]